MAEAVLVASLAALAAAVWMLFRVQRTLEEKHRQVLADLHDGLARQSDRLAASIGELREAVSSKLDARLDQISSRVNERLDEGFRKTNDTFVNVMQRLSTIDEAQKKIETLTGSVVELHELLGDKKTRGAFGEVQLEALVRNTMPGAAFEMQYTLSNGTRADCVLKLPAPTGMVCVDSKFPLENYNRMFDREAARPTAPRRGACSRPTCGATSTTSRASTSSPARRPTARSMFLPGGSRVRRDPLPTTPRSSSTRTRSASGSSRRRPLMAVLNTARAVLKDVETRKQVDVIKDALGRLAAEFNRFDERPAQARRAHRPGLRRRAEDPDDRREDQPPVPANRVRRTWKRSRRRTSCGSRTSGSRAGDQGRLKGSRSITSGGISVGLKPGSGGTLPRAFSSTPFVPSARKRPVCPAGFSQPASVTCGEHEQGSALHCGFAVARVFALRSAAAASSSR
jgi:DNA recombination protein RmuC